MNPILKRRLASLNYEDPETILRRLMPTIVGILQKPETVSHLSAKQKNKLLEEHQAAFLAFMMKHIAGCQARVTVCVKELDDFDCTIKGEIGSDTVYKPVQLKQLPSRQVNREIELQGIINKLKTQYPTSSDLVVAIWINRDIKLDFRLLRFDGLKIEQLWFFGDSVTGNTTLDGGVVADLISGVRWSGLMRNGIPTVRRIRFKPNLADACQPHDA